MQPTLTAEAAMFRDSLHQMLTIVETARLPGGYGLGLAKAMLEFARAYMHPNMIQYCESTIDAAGRAL